MNGLTKDEEINLKELQAKKLRAEHEREERKHKEKMKGYLFWCSEGCGFVDEDHRCEQWTNITYIPPMCSKSIRLAVIEELEAEVGKLFCFSSSTGTASIHKKDVESLLAQMKKEG